MTATLEPPDAAGNARDFSGVTPALDLVNAVLRRRRVVAVTTVVVLSLSLLPALVRVARGKRTYSSEALITTSARRNTGSLTGLTAQLGVAVPGTDATQSPNFFVDLLKSHEMLARVAASRVTEAGQRDSVTLAAHYDIDDENPASRLEKTTRELDAHLDVTSSQKSSIITIKVTDSDANVARELAARIVQILSELNVASRQSQASLERKFTERRSKEAGVELRAAEERQRAFASGNRGGSSPDLSLERERLGRDVTMRQQIYTQMMQSYEQARVEEVRDTPALIIIQEPYLPVRAEPRGLVAKSFIAAILGVALGVFFVFLLEVAEGLREQNPTRYAETLQRLARLRHELLRPWKLLQ